MECLKCCPLPEIHIWEEMTLTRCVYIYIYDIFKTELSFLVKSFLSLSPIFLFVGGI